ncbi:MAG: tetratricopeptide repeat protein [Rhodospirillales bacterium]
MPEDKADATDREPSKREPDATPSPRVTAASAEASDLGGLVKHWVFERFGWPGMVVLAVASVAFWCWWNWDTLRGKPVVADLLAVMQREPLPTADPRRFSVAIADLENDDDGDLKRLIVEDLAEFAAVSVLPLPRTIVLGGGAREESERGGHDQARRYLADTGASVLMWGTVLRHEARVIPKLYLTVAPTGAGVSGRYPPNEELRLPALFWQDLAAVLRLVVASQDAEFRARQGHYVADRLAPFIARVRQLLIASETAAGWDGDARASTLAVFGGALSILGEQTGQSGPLEEAVVAYRAALQEWTRERVPLAWAATQNNLGNVLRSLGDRESGTDRLEEAVAAYRAALEEFTRERVPLQWAGTQTNLGNALASLGEREGGTARLEAAVAAHRAALEELTREQVPLDWAATQNNLGNALRSLGEREGGTARLEEAVAAYRAALEERTRERVPLDWAGTQNNLGNAPGVSGSARAARHGSRRRWRPTGRRWRNGPASGYRWTGRRPRTTSATHSGASGSGRAGQVVWRRRWRRFGRR